MCAAPLRRFDPDLIQEPLVYRLYEVRTAGARGGGLALAEAAALRRIEQEVCTGRHLP